MFIYSSTTRTIENAKERVGECRGVITESIRMVNLLDVVPCLCTTLLGRPGIESLQIYFAKRFVDSRPRVFFDLHSSGDFL